MKEFYFYTLKQSYIDEYSRIKSSLSHANKHALRLGICIKDRKGQNWFLPLTSIDPTKPNYLHKSSYINRHMQNEKKL